MRHATRLSLPFLEFLELLQRFGGFDLVLHFAIRARQQKKWAGVVRVQRNRLPQRFDGFKRPAEFQKGFPQGALRIGILRG